MITQATPSLTSATASPGSPWQIPKNSQRLANELSEIENKMRRAHGVHLGYPYNLVGRAAVPAALGNYLINNLGDPYVGSHFGSEVCNLEREAVSWLMQLWQCDDESQFWGSIGASGTEGNFWAIYLGREALLNPVLLYSDDAHYSIPKAAKILGLEARSIASQANGELSLTELSQALIELQDRSVILALTCGTTVKGAHDDIAGAIATLDASGHGPDRRYIHVDGALNAMVLPFIADASSAIRPSFRQSIDSISTSGHKMIGTPMPCGVLVAKRELVDRVASKVDYLRSHDTTLMGSRNGHAVLAIWARLMGHGYTGFQQDVTACLQRTAEFVRVLRNAEVPILLNKHSLTVVFPEPNEVMVNKYQLACNRGEAHAIVMPNVTDWLLNEFIDDYLAWWTSNSVTSECRKPFPH